MNVTAQVLRDAADLIDRDGWTRGRYEYDGRRCVLAAIRAVSDGNLLGPRADAIDALVHHIGGQTLGVWNDSRRSRTPVLWALRDCADYLDKEPAS